MALLLLKEALVEEPVECNQFYDIESIMAVLRARFGLMPIIGLGEAGKPPEQITGVDTSPWHGG